MKPSRALGILLLSGTAFVALPNVAAAQDATNTAQPPVPPFAQRDETWGTVSSITMLIGAGTVTLMPRVYYNDPEATVGWKARFHFSQLAPALAITAATLLVDQPIKDALEGTRPGCTVDETRVAFPDSGCESFGGPSTHSFAAWGAAGAGFGIWISDTFIHSDGNVHVGSIIGNIAVPVTAAVITSVGRGVEPGAAEAYEDPGQIIAGVGFGLVFGFLSGLAYSALQEPNCGYGNNVVCW